MQSHTPLPRLPARSFNVTGRRIELRSARYPARNVTKEHIEGGSAPRGLLAAQDRRHLAVGDAEAAERMADQLVTELALGNDHVERAGAA
jgi:hypothetical protein